MGGGGFVLHEPLELVERGRARLAAGAGYLHAGLGVGEEGVVFLFEAGEQQGRGLGSHGS